MEKESKIKTKEGESGTPVRGTEGAGESRPLFGVWGSIEENEYEGVEGRMCWRGKVGNWAKLAKVGRAY